MERNQFLALMGTGAATVFFGGCLGSCSSSGGDDDPAPNNPGGSTKKDFTLNLNDAANSALLTNGGHLTTNGVIVAKTAAGNYIAVSSACTHQGNPLNFESGNNQFHCNAHGSNFGLDGKVINGPAGAALKQYKTTLTGTSLRVFE